MPVLPTPARTRAPVNVSWQRAGSARRRRLADGWGFTAAGCMLLFCGWGIWAALGGRGVGGLPVISLALVVIVAAAVFATFRVAGLVLIEKMGKRERMHARWSHFFTGLFLTAVGIWYVTNADLSIDVIAWIREQWQRL